jgi:hypothetical protein
MADPLICPQDYSCQFTQVHPRVIEHIHNIGHWYNGTAGWIVAIIAIICITGLLAYIANFVHEGREARVQRMQRERELKHKTEIAEQLTMQLDACKGNPEMLKMVKELQQQ